MATRGRKPTPPALKLVTGNPGKRSIPETPDPDQGGDETPERGCDLAKPKYIKGKAAEIWVQVVETCWWLGDADIYAIGMFCSLQAEYERGPSKMIAARIAQLRAVRSELGLEPSSRARLGSMRGGRKTKGEKEGEAKSKTAKYFE